MKQIYREVTEEMFKTRMQELEQWKKKHNMVFNPHRDVDHFVRTALSYGDGCPCRQKDRLKCPCPESVTECKSDGQCVCGLFMLLH